MLGKTGTSSSCEHLRGRALYIKNDGTGPPVVYIEHVGAAVVATLTNQTIYLNCPACFNRLRSTQLLKPIDPLPRG